MFHEAAAAWIVIGGIYMGTGEVQQSKIKWWIGFGIAVMASLACL